MLCLHVCQFTFTRIIPRQTSQKNHFWAISSFSFLTGNRIKRSNLTDPSGQWRHELWARCGSCLEPQLPLLWHWNAAQGLDRGKMQWQLLVACPNSLWASCIPCNSSLGACLLLNNNMLQKCFSIFIFWCFKHVLHNMAEISKRFSLHHNIFILGEANW